MGSKNTHRIRLFGVDIIVRKNDQCDDHDSGTLPLIAQQVTSPIETPPVVLPTMQAQKEIQNGMMICSINSSISKDGRSKKKMSKIRGPTKEIRVFAQRRGPGQECAFAKRKEPGKEIRVFAERKPRA